MLRHKSVSLIPTVRLRLPKAMRRSNGTSAERTSPSSNPQICAAHRMVFAHGPHEIGPALRTAQDCGDKIDMKAGYIVNRIGGGAH